MTHYLSCESEKVTNDLQVLSEWNHSAWMSYRVGEVAKTTSGKVSDYENATVGDVLHFIFGAWSGAELFLVTCVFNIMYVHACCVLPCNAVALVSDRQLNRNLSMTVFKVWDTTRQLKKLVVAATLSEIIDKGCPWARLSLFCTIIMSRILYALPAWGGFRLNRQ